MKIFGFVTKMYHYMNLFGRGAYYSISEPISIQLVVHFPMLMPLSFVSFQKKDICIQYQVYYLSNIARVDLSLNIYLILNIKQVY